MNKKLIIWVRNEIKKVEREQDNFKGQTHAFTKWETGEDIRDYLDGEEGVNYGRLLGMKDGLEKCLKRLKITQKTENLPSEEKQ